MSKDKRSIQKLRREAFVGWHQDLDWGNLLQNAYEFNEFILFKDMECRKT